MTRILSQTQERIAELKKKREQGSKSNGFPLLGRELNSQVVGGVKLNQPAQSAEKQLKDHLNPDVPELELPIPSPRHIVYDNVTGTVNNVTPKEVDYNSSKINDETNGASNVTTTAHTNSI